MKPSNPTLLSSTLDGVELVLDVNPDLFWFKGHFPVQPILPGVAQIDWVMHYAKQYLTAGYQFERIVQVKFKKPVLPNTQLRLSLHWQLDRRLLTFDFEKNTPQGEGSPLSYSQGKIRLCRAN